MANYITIWFAMITPNAGDNQIQAHFKIVDSQIITFQIEPDDAVDWLA